MAATEMDWTYPAGAGDSGIFEIGRRLSEALGRAPDATRFTYDPRAMLRTTRDIERASTGGRRWSRWPRVSAPSSVRIAHW